MTPRCVNCGGPDAAGNGCEHCPGVDLDALTDAALRDLIGDEREQGRAWGQTAEAARLLLALRTGVAAQ